MKRVSMIGSGAQNPERLEGGGSALNEAGLPCAGCAAAQSVSRRRRWRQLAERDTLAAHHGQLGLFGLGHAPAGRAGKRRALSDAGGGASCAPWKRGAGTLRCASGGGR